MSRGLPSGRMCARRAPRLHHAESRPGNRVESRGARRHRLRPRRVRLKDTIKALLDEMAIPYDDFGTTTAASVDYPDFAEAVARAVVDGRRRPRHPGLRHRHRHGHRREQDPRHPRRAGLGRGDRPPEPRRTTTPTSSPSAGARRRRDRVARHRARVPRHAVRGRPPRAPPRQDRPGSNAKDTHSHGHTTVTAHTPQPAGDRPGGRRRHPRRGRAPGQRASS